MAIEITNGQKVRASFDLFDNKGKAFSEWPAGSTLSVTGGDTGGPTGIGQWVPDASPENGKGLITTDGDNVGPVSFAGTGTTPAGESFSGTLEIVVIHGPPSSAAFTVGTPEAE